GGDGFESSIALATDSSDSIFATGRFELSVDFNPEAQNPDPDQPKVSNGGVDIFITKYNTFGKFSKAIAIGGEGWDQSHNIAIDPNDKVLITGEFSENVDFNPFAGTDEHVSNGHRDIFVSKFDNGLFVYDWTQSIGGPGADYGRDITTDSSGNIYVTGDFENTVEFNPADENDSRTSLGLSDAFLTQFDIDGAYGWTIAFGGVDFDHSYGVAVDAVRNTYLTGSFTAEVDFDPSDQQEDTKVSNGLTDIFVTNYDTNRPPTIDSMTATPDPVNRGANLTLKTLGTFDIDGGVSNVLFYHDSDKDNHLNTENDLLLGNGMQLDLNDPSTWTWIGSSGMFPVGNNTFFAQAWDKNLANSEPVSASLRINDIPIIVSLTDNPDPVIQG
ncbi:MAG: hypothetical protein GY869_23365, partial [Planctomycetes bacterium]|nr:hypothetical protein [Planctomycetota bacterium]